MLILPCSTYRWVSYTYLPMFVPIHPSILPLFLPLAGPLFVCLSNCISLWQLSPSACAHLCFSLSVSLLVSDSFHVSVSFRSISSAFLYTPLRVSVALTLGRVPLWLFFCGCLWVSSVYKCLCMSLCLYVFVFLCMCLLSIHVCLSLHVCVSSVSLTLCLISVSVWECLCAHRCLSLRMSLSRLRPTLLSLSQSVCLLIVFLLLWYLSSMSLRMCVFLCVSMHASLCVCLYICICVFFIEFTISPLYLCLLSLFGFLSLSLPLCMHFSTSRSLNLLYHFVGVCLSLSVCLLSFFSSVSLALCLFLFLLVSLLQNVGLFVYTSFLVCVRACMCACAYLLLSNTLVRTNTLHSVP